MSALEDFVAAAAAHNAAAAISAHRAAEAADRAVENGAIADLSEYAKKDHTHALEETPVTINGSPHIISWDAATETFILTPRN